jgi:hypothetical protein
VGAMWAASFGSYNQATRQKMLAELSQPVDNGEGVEV